MDAIESACLPVYLWNSGGLGCSLFCQVPGLGELVFHALGQFDPAFLRRAIAAMLGEEGEQLVHPRKLCSIEHEFPILPTIDQPRMRELFHVEGQGRRRQLELFSNLSDRHPRFASHHEQAIDAQACWLSQSGKGNDGLISIHQGCAGAPDRVAVQLNGRLSPEHMTDSWRI